MNIVPRESLKLIFDKKEKLSFGKKIKQKRLTLM